MAEQGTYFLMNSSHTRLSNSKIVKSVRREKNLKMFAVAITTADVAHYISNQ